LNARYFDFFVSFFCFCIPLFINFYSTHSLSRSLLNTHSFVSLSYFLHLITDLQFVPQSIFYIITLVSISVIFLFIFLRHTATFYYTFSCHDEPFQFYFKFSSSYTFPLYILLCSYFVEKHISVSLLLFCFLFNSILSEKLFQQEGMPHIYGVLQGFHLGPFLRPLFIHDADFAFKNNCKNLQ
jgi:hypothetical protein